MDIKTDEFIHYLQKFDLNLSWEPDDLSPLVLKEAGLETHFLLSNYSLNYYEMGWRAFGKALEDKDVWSTVCNCLKCTIIIVQLSMEKQSVLGTLPDTDITRYQTPHWASVIRYSTVQYSSSFLHTERPRQAWKSPASGKKLNARTKTADEERLQELSTFSPQKQRLLDDFQKLLKHSNNFMTSVYIMLETTLTCWPGTVD